MTTTVARSPLPLYQMHPSWGLCHHPSERHLAALHPPLWWFFVPLFVQFSLLQQQQHLRPQKGKKTNDGELAEEQADGLGITALAGVVVELWRRHGGKQREPGGNAPQKRRNHPLGLHLLFGPSGFFPPPLFSPPGLGSWRLAGASVRSCGPGGRCGCWMHGPPARAGQEGAEDQWLSPGTEL